MAATRADGGPSADAATIAVVIVNWNGGELLARALAAVDGQTLRPQRVIVVDNASTDGSADDLESHYPGAQVVRLNENAGFARANNVGAATAADCDWLALLNPDAFPEPDWLERLSAAALEHPDYSAFGSCLLLADDPLRYDGTGDVYHVSGLAFRRDHGRMIARVRRPTAEVFAPSGAAAMFRADAFRAAGGFDETYFAYLEDVDLAFRLRLAGERCLFVADAVVHHVGSAIAGRTSDFTIFHSQRNLIWTYAKNMPSPFVWLYLPQHLLVNAAAVLGYALRGQGRVVLRSKRAALRSLGSVLRERRQLQADRVVGAGELRRLMGKGLEAYVAPLRRAWETWH
ncbi:MAG: glycosyltransferase family 2 protein [Gaiellaceae bacterium]